MAEVLTVLTPTIVEVIGEVELAKRGRVLGVALVDWGTTSGIGVDVRVFVTDAALGRSRAAQLKTARTGRAFRGPTRQGILMQPGDADELSEPLALAGVKVESISAGGA
jgi:hypothetical protein